MDGGAVEQKRTARQNAGQLGIAGGEIGYYVGKLPRGCSGRCDPGGGPGRREQPYLHVHTPRIWALDCF